jgi:outer membrane protein assembly factor BamB
VPRLLVSALPVGAPADGAELWRVKCLAGELTPSPVLAGGLVLAVSPGAKLFAIRPDGIGDVSTTHGAWVAKEGVPDITSPVSDGQRVYLLTTGGLLTCYQLKTGQKIWEKDLQIEFRASPTLAGDRLYLFGRKGQVIVAAAGPTAPSYQELSRFGMADEITSSPAFADGRIILRTAQYLYCVGAR